MAKTWRKEFWLLMLNLDQCRVGRSWMFHAKLQMKLLLFTFWDMNHKRTTFGLECWQLKGNGSFFLRTTLVMHVSVLETRTPMWIQRWLGSALGCLLRLHRYLQATCICPITYASIHMRMSNMYISVCKVCTDGSGKWVRTHIWACMHT